MLSSVLRSPRAIQVNIAIIRVFVRLRETLALHKELAHKLAELERKIEGHDAHTASWPCSQPRNAMLFGDTSTKCTPKSPNAPITACTVRQRAPNCSRFSASHSAQVSSENSGGAPT